MQLAYDQIVVEADRLIVKLALSNCLNRQYYQELYILFITACGWSDSLFDEETMRRVDLAWDELYYKKYIIWN